MSKRVLVTGGSGKVGKWVIADLLAHGYLVTNADRQKADNVQTIDVDLRDMGHTYAAMAGMDAVVHLAAIPSPQGHAPEVVFHTNVMSTFNVLQAASILGIRKVVIASSLSALGLAYSFHPVDLQYFPIDEAHPLLAQDAYGLSKIAGEDLADGFARRDPALSVTSLRFTLVLTPDELETAIPNLQAREKDSASILWTYIDVRDAARCIRLCLEDDSTGHRAFYINANNTFMQKPTLDLLQMYYSNVPCDTMRLQAYTAPIDCSAGNQFLKFQPEYEWTRTHNLSQ